MEEIKTKILITGSTGMLGEALCKELSKEYELTGLSHKDCDITQRQETVRVIAKVSPDLVIHTAALTNVDKCEVSADYAYKVNVDGTENVARAVKEIGADLIYISTDHVFDGTKSTPYQENDKLNPINIYGKTKLEGENIVKNLVKKYVIIRTSWLFGKRGRGFVETVLGMAKREKLLKIANDKFSTPTYSLDLAKAILKTVNKLPADLYGIYHVTNEGSCNWFEYALRVLELAQLKDIKVAPIKFEELNLPAKRPMYSVLDKSRFYNLIGYKLRPWQDALREYLNARGFKE